MRFNAVLLDLDGTLVNTIADLADATNAMLAELGHAPLSLETVTSYVGKGSETLVMRALTRDLTQDAAAPNLRSPSAADTATALDIFFRHYRRLNGLRSELYPGVLEGLRAFRQAKVKLAVVTNKPEEFTHTLLVRKGLAHFFDAVVCGDTCERKKPHPMPLLHACNILDVPPSHALMIGDSMNDARAARAAGIAVLAVPYGYNENQSVQDLDVDDIVSSIQDAARWAAQEQQTQNS